MSDYFFDLDHQINKALQLMGDPGTPRTLLLLPPPEIITEIYRLPLRFRHLYMLADSIATRAELDFPNSSQTDEESVLRILDIIDTHLENNEKQFKNCFSIVYCEDWIVVPFSQAEALMLNDLLDLNIIPEGIDKMH